MEPQDFPYKRIIVVGVTGAGKSTLAEKLAQKYGLDFIELDALHWLPNWEHVSEQELRERVELATRAPGWVIAGNYRVARDISWPKAEAIVWLDYPFWTVFWRLWRRTWRRWWTQELLWGTNREDLFPQFKIWSPEASLFRWLFDTYGQRKREYPLLFNLPEYAHLKVIHQHSPKETEAWLQNLA